MATIPFIGLYEGRSKVAGTLKLVNFYPASINNGTVAVLHGTPGISAFAYLGANPARGMHVINDILYVVAGSTLYTVDNTGGVAVISTALLTSTGSVSMADNGTQLMIVDGTNGYIYNTGTRVFAKITDGDFPASSTVTFLDGYFIVSETNTGRFHSSSLYNGLTWAALDFATAESSPDNVVSVKATFQSLFVIGKYSTEIWYNAGTAGFPFAANKNVTTAAGCLSASTVVRTGDAGGTLLWLAQASTGGGFVVRTDGGVPVSVTTPEIEFTWGTYPDIADAAAFAYRQEGRNFYVINFPVADKSWCYDIDLNTWHQRSSGTDGGKLIYDRHAYLINKHIVASGIDGQLYIMDNDVYTENGEAIVREAIMPKIGNAESKTSFVSFQLVMETGQGLSTGQGYDPQVMLTWSSDHGRTYGNEHWIKSGKQGEYQLRAIWRQLGTSFFRTFKIVISDPVKCSIIYAAVVV